MRFLEGTVNTLFHATSTDLGLEWVDHGTPVAAGTRTGTVVAPWQDRNLDRRAALAMAHARRSNVGYVSGDSSSDSDNDSKKSDDDTYVPDSDDDTDDYY